MIKATILVVSAAKSAPPELSKALDVSEWRVVSAPLKAIDGSLSSISPDCVIFCSDDGHRQNIELLLSLVKSLDDNLPFIPIVSSSSLEDIVAIMKGGAYDYFQLPLDAEKLRHSIAHAVKLYQLAKRVYLLESQVGWREEFDDMVGRSGKMQEIFSMIQMVAKSNATVLVQGASGTGKELVAKAIHRHSSRNGKPFIDINCGAIPRELLENELFGHERGAFTGADRRYSGSVERAHQGSLFLDEVSEMDAALQVKLLRFLQERTFTRVGGNEQLAVDVRIIAATNRDLVKEVKEGRFREDLFYRLNVVPIVLPPLCERPEDIPLLAKHFLEKYSERCEKIFLDFAPQVTEKLCAYDWPGNVRELENVIERLVVLYNDSRVKVQHLPLPIQQGSGQPPKAAAAVNHEGGERILPLELVEKYAIEAALAQCYGNVMEAAGKLKIGQATLYRKIKQYGLRT